MTLSPEAQYLLLVVGLFVLPRVLQRFALPSAITCVGLGAVMGMGFHLFVGDPTVGIMATFGIVALFLFAGLEVVPDDLVKGARVLAWHLLVQSTLIACGAWSAAHLFGLAWRPALLFSLAVLTPSTGFILDSLASFGLTAPQRFWVTTKAVASELVALAVLFVTVQSGSAQGLCLSALAMVAMIAVLPTVFRAFFVRVLPHAPRSEFAFLLIVALVCAYATRRLGVYYLVGAFVVGVTAVRLRRQLPALGSERVLIAVELFASFFIPMYFFKAGLHLHREYFTLEALGIGTLLVLAVVPTRVAAVAVMRRIALDEPPKASARVGLSLVPTLVFTIVLADIMQQRYQLPDRLYGALLIFTLTNTTLPGLVLRSPPPEFDTPEVPREPSPSPPTLVAATKHAAGDAPGRVAASSS